MKALFEAIGYSVGKAAGIYDLLGGGEEESLRAEILLGHHLAAAVLERKQLVAANPSTSFAQEIGRWLSRHLKEKKVPFALRITAEAELNAWALPGGHIFMSWPLLRLCQEQRDEIAFVVAHEMGHIVLRHATDRLFSDSILSLLLRQSPGKQAARVWLEKVGRQALSRACSRASELEADSFAVKLIKSCGWDILAAERLLKKLAQHRPPQSNAVWTEFLATHPPLPERIAHLKTQRSV